MNSSVMRKEVLTIILHDLYESILAKNGKNSRRLRVIAGYASSGFLRRVKKDFPELEIELYIGMYKDGISLNDHHEFMNLCSEFNDVSVFYQVREKPTHIKLIEFSSDYSSKVYVGSANFSDNGFFKHKELMINIYYDASSLFDIQLSKSLKCDNKNIRDFIKFYLDNNSDKKTVIVDDDKTPHETLKEDVKNYMYRYSTGGEPIELNNSFKLELVLEEEYNPHWEKTGINAWTNGKTPHLLQTPKDFFDKIFPVGKVFKIVTDEFVFEAELGGDFNRELVFLNGDIYEYIRGKIGLKEKRAISRKDLVEYGQTSLRFVKVRDGLYEMTL